jgi:hypothetical protein
LNTLPLNDSFDDTTFGVPVDFLDAFAAAGLDAADRCFFPFFAAAERACISARGLAIGFALERDAGSTRDLFEEAAMGLRYHPASGAEITHPIELNGPICMGAEVCRPAGASRTTQMLRVLDEH